MDLSGYSDAQLKAIAGEIDPDTDKLVRTVWGEARNQDATGRKAVAAVVRNRSRATGQPISAVVTAPGQFEPWNNPETRAQLEGLDPASDEYQAILRDIEGDEDPTGGATHFYSPKAQAALGRQAPGWDDGSGVEIGDHRFFRPGGERALAGGAGSDDLSSMSDEELAAIAGEAAAGEPEWQEIGRGKGISIEVERPAQAVPAPAQPQLRKDQGLGFQKGVVKPLDNAAKGLEWLADTVGLDEPVNRLGAALGLPSNQQVAGDRKAALDRAAAQGRAPGGLGEFAGNVVGSLPLGLARGGALVQGALGGAALTDAEDAQGVLRDAAVGAVAGKVADKALGAVSKSAQAVLGKAPKVMSLPELEAAKNAAYKAVDDAGFTIPSADVRAMVDDFVKTVSGSALSKSAKDDARSIVQYARTLAKGDLPLTQLEKLRGDIYEAMVKKGGDTGKVGQQFRAKIDTLIDAVDSDLVRNARDLNTRWNKARTVDRASRSSDIKADKDYGGDYGRKLKDRLFPLIDPANPNRNLRGASKDELAAIERIVRGTKGQNAASMVGGMLDPRRLGGKILAGATTTTGGATAPLSGGLSLLLPAAQMAAGFGLTAAASKTARRNMDDLLKLIAAGGSKEALKKTPTAASRATSKAAAKARPVSGLIGASMAAQTRSGGR